MGLDCYMRLPGESEEEVSFPGDLKLCGGMLSGHCCDGSFRGKVYTEFFSENLGVLLYNDLPPEEVAEVADGLASLIKEYPSQAWDMGGWRADAPSMELSYYGVTAQEVNDLFRLFQSAAAQQCEMVASY